MDDMIEIRHGRVWYECVDLAGGDRCGVKHRKLETALEHRVKFERELNEHMFVKLGKYKPEVVLEENIQNVLVPH